MSQALAQALMIRDPLLFGKALWPQFEFYDRQREVIRGVRDSVETHVRAGNKLGKDFVSGFIALSFLLRPQMYFPAIHVAQIEATRTSKDHPLVGPHFRRVVTTSVKDEHLDVLWAEIGRFATTSRVPLMARGGGPLVMLHHEIRFAHDSYAKNPASYLKGMVSLGEEGMSGHHAPYTLMIGDEASGISDLTYSAAQGWAKRFLFIGNPNPCSNFWFKGIKAGNLKLEA